MKTYHVYGIGNALVDKEFEVTDDFFTHENIQKGVMTLIDGESQNVLLTRLLQRFELKKMAGGGSAANTIYAISQFGGKTFYSCKVASDEFGQFYVNELGDLNIHTNLSENREYGTTGKCIVMVSPDTERTMLTYLGISEKFSVNDLNYEALKDSEYLYIEGYLVTSPTGRSAAIAARKVAEANGVKTALTLSDPAMVQFFRGGLEEMVGDGVDILFANESEAHAWTGKDTINESIEVLKGIAKVIVVTLGSKGALIYDGSRKILIDAVPVKAIDSNGAGDMFAGAFLYAIAAGESLEFAGNLASLAAATTVCNFGPRLLPAQHKEILETGKKKFQK
jgi:sugar/nucleoside kinase (ribokinase family)